MNVTNPHDFPMSYVAAMADRRIPQPNRISVTELLQPPQMRSLWLDNFDEIPLVIGEDDHDLFHGNAVHFYLAHHARAEAITEERLSYVVDGWEIHGTPDYAELSGQDWVGLGDGGLLIDWKTTKVRALQYDKVEWEQQTNLYAYLLQVNGVQINRLVIWAFLKDWDRNKRGEDGYPSSHACRMEPPLWPITEQHNFLMERLRLHREAQDGVYRPCTPEERWQHTSYAITKKGNSRATHAGIRSREEAYTLAQAYLQPLQAVEDWWDVRTDTTPPLRCQGYCPVRDYCVQRKHELMQMQGGRNDLVAEYPLAGTPQV